MIRAGAFSCDPPPQSWRDDRESFDLRAKGIVLAIVTDRLIADRVMLAVDARSKFVGAAVVTAEFGLAYAAVSFPDAHLIGIQNELPFEMSLCTHQEHEVGPFHHGDLLSLAAHKTAPSLRTV
jgi:hypothetical protein